MKKVSNKDRKSTFVIVRVTAEEKLRLTASVESGSTLSKLVRRLLGFE